MDVIIWGVLFTTSISLWRLFARIKCIRTFKALVLLLFVCALIFYLRERSSDVLSSHPHPKVEEYYTSQTCHCDKLYASHTYSRGPDDNQIDWCSPESKVRGPGQQVISYTLYGSATEPAVFERYFAQIDTISQTAAQLYPGWIVRIYHDFDESESVYQKMLCSSYCKRANLDLCNVPQIAKRIRAHPESVAIEADLVSGLNPKMYRYLAMLDPDVDVVLSRDVDSVVRPREVAAVKEWLASNYTFHLMRDHPSHNDIILAGMFGVKVHQRRDLIQGLFTLVIEDGQDHYTLQDQTALYNILWPVAKHDVMAHDSYQCENEKLKKASPIKLFPFPSKREGNYYVGAVGDEANESDCPVACRPPNHLDWNKC